MLAFINTILNTLIRNVNYTIRVMIAFGLFFFSVLCLLWSIRKKNDKYPIAWGWFILCVISMFLSSIYLTL